jgi:hypothetical protein
MTDPKLTPPPELVREWATTNGTSYEDLSALCQNIATRAAQYGADQELEALLVWLRVKGFDNLASDLLSARRPKPPSLKEQALEALETLIHGDSTGLDVGVIRRALEAINDD